MVGKVHLNRFSYDSYMNEVMRLDLVRAHLLEFVPFFENCSHVIDVGCGTGIFLELLKTRGINATGIENDSQLVKGLSGRGFDVVAGNAVTVWKELDLEYDGVFCSHLIEHLNFDAVIDLIEGMLGKLSATGIVVLAFPNPESIEMQLFQFWRDPQHVRFYHPDLIAGVLKHYGMEIVQTYTQGTWGPFEQFGANSGNDLTKKPVIPAHLKSLGRWVKNILGITPLEVEADYMRKLRKVGREAVIVARRR